MRVIRIKFGSPLVSIKRIVNLVVARLVECAKVVPNLGDEGVQTDCARVRVQGIPVLVDLVVQHTNGTPERWVSPIAIDGLLISLIRFGVLLLRHVAAPKQIPALRVVVICGDRFLEILDGPLLTLESLALLMVQPSKLLKNLGMIGITLKYSLISRLCIIVIFLLFVHVTDLKPDVLFSQRRWWRVYYVLEALQTLTILLLLLVDYTKPEIDLVCFVEAGFHLHDLGEGFFRVIQGSIPIVQDTDTVPETRLLWVLEVDKSGLIRRIGILQVIHHEIAMAEAAPCLTVVRVELENPMQVVRRLGELLLCAQHQTDGIERPDRRWVVAQRLFIRVERIWQVSNCFGKASKSQPHFFVQRCQCLSK